MSEESESSGGDREPFIVVGVDGSRASIAAVTWAIDHARRIGARVEVIGAWEVPWSELVSPTKVDDDYFRQVRERLEPAIAEALTGADDVHTVVRIVEWYPGPALVQAAEHAEMLVVGSHRYGVMGGMHLGSVASYCAHHAPCPVLIHRHR